MDSSLCYLCDLPLVEMIPKDTIYAIGQHVRKKLGREDDRITNTESTLKLVGFFLHFVDKRLLVGIILVINKANSTYSFDAT